MGWKAIESESWSKLPALCEMLRSRQDLDSAARSEVHFIAGFAYSDLQDYERALEDYGRAIALNPEDATAYNNRGLAYSDLQDYERALEDYGRAIALNPEDATAYYNRSCAYALMSCAGEACEWLQKAIDLDEKYRPMAREDQDFDAIREHACFKALMSADTSLNERAAPGG
jgi:tetratricopeptide (TPR) repeat protein